MHVPDDEGIERDGCLNEHEQYGAQTYMHVPDDEGIESNLKAPKDARSHV